MLLIGAAEIGPSLHMGAILLQAHNKLQVWKVSMATPYNMQEYWSFIFADLFYKVLPKQSRVKIALMNCRVIIN